MKHLVSANISENISDLSSKGAVPFERNLYLSTSVKYRYFETERSGLRIGLINIILAQGRTSGLGKVGFYNSFSETSNMSSMDVHASSLLSPVRAPIDLAEERSALSQQYSDTVSNVQDQDNHRNPDGSSLRPLCLSASTHQADQHELSDTAVFSDSMLTDLKKINLCVIF